MAYFGGDQEHRDLAHARQIERRAQAAERRQNPDRERHEKAARQSGSRGRIMWKRLIANVVGGAVAIGLFLFLLARL